MEYFYFPPRMGCYSITAGAGLKIRVPRSADERASHEATTPPLLVSRLVTVEHLSTTFIKLLNEKPTLSVSSFLLYKARQ